ncbi:MAG: DNA polymerase III subunit delta [Bacillota bacterium]
MISFKAVIKQIAEGKFAPVYLVFGEEKYLQEELVSRLEKSFLGQDFEFGREKLNGAEYSLEEILSRLSEESLFSKRNMIIVENPSYLAPPRKGEEREASPEGNVNGSKEKTYTEMFNNYIAAQAPQQPDNIIVFTTPGVDRRKKMFKLLDQKGVVVECSPLKGDALVSWVRHKVGRLGKKIDRAAVERLLLAGDHNLHYLSRELEKYCAYLGSEQDTITVETVDYLFSGDLPGNVFKLSDALAEGNLKKANHFLQLLLKRREKPLLILFMLVRHYRLLLQAHSLLEEGIPQNELIPTLKVHDFVARKLKQQVAYYDRMTLEDALIILQKLDMQVKTGRIEPEQALELGLNQINFIQKKGSGRIS